LCLAATVATVLVPTIRSDAHPGRTDAEGCHRQEAERHCHRDPNPQTPRRLQVLVERVVDGDTLHVRVLDVPPVPLIVRIKGIDCPESRRNAKCIRDGDCESDAEPGRRATEKLSELVAGKIVVLESSVNGDFEKDDYGRTLAYVDLSDGTDVGLALVRGGYCVDWSHKYPHPRSSDYVPR